MLSIFSLTFLFYSFVCIPLIFYTDYEILFCYTGLLSCFFAILLVLWDVLVSFQKKT